MKIIEYPMLGHLLHTPLSSVCWLLCV